MPVRNKNYEVSTQLKTHSIKGGPFFNGITLIKSPICEFKTVNAVIASYGTDARYFMNQLPQNIKILYYFYILYICI